MKKFLDIDCSESTRLLLFENSLNSIPFNLIIALLLGADLVYNRVPDRLVLAWILAITGISLVRYVYSKLSIKNSYYKNTLSISWFIGLTFLMGSVWGLSYLLFLPYVNQVTEVIIILILGGMSAGGLSSLSFVLPAYYAYIWPMLLPAIVYNFSRLSFDRIMMGTSLLLFIIMIIFTALISANQYKKTLRLLKEQDDLILALKKANDQLDESVNNIRILSITDSLTNIFNRRFFDQSLQNEFNRAKRNEYPLNLIMIDIDGFKYINDHYGHPTGDEYLIETAQLLQSCIHRANDSLFRTGGDEFAIILANLSFDKAKTFCMQVQDKFRQHNKYPQITLSFGVVFMPPDYANDLTEMISEADKALYQAKNMGKNQICSKILNHEMV